MPENSRLNRLNVTNTRMNSSIGWIMNHSGRLTEYQRGKLLGLTKSPISTNLPTNISNKKEGQKPLFFINTKPAGY